MKHPDSSGHVEQIHIGVPIKTTQGEAAFNFNVLHLWNKLSPVSLFRSGILFPSSSLSINHKHNPFSYLCFCKCNLLFNLCRCLSTLNCFIFHRLPDILF